MKLCWQVVLVNIRSMQRMVRNFFSPSDEAISISTFPKLLGLAALLLPLQFLVGCDSTTSTPAPAFLSKPQLLSYDSVVPLSAAVTFESDQSVVATYKISDGQSSWQAHTLFDQSQKPVRLNTSHSSKSHLSKSHLSKSHRDFLLKFKPETKHQIYVRITNASGQTTEYAKPLNFYTPALPEGFPKIEDLVTTEGVYDQSASVKQNDIALISAINKQSEPNLKPQKQDVTGWLLAVDSHSAEIVWYMPTDIRWQSLEQLKTGNLLLYTPLGSALEIDMLGNKLAAWPAPKDTEFASNQAYQALPVISDKAAIASPAASKIPSHLDSALITDMQWVSRLIPPQFNRADYQKYMSRAPNKALSKPQPEPIISNDIIVTEGDWRIVLESPEGLTEQILTIDKQQGSIGLGYLDNYPVMVVLKGNRMQFKVRTSGADERVTWHYQGLLDDNGLEAQGELRLLDEQNDVLGLAIPWQAYRQ